MGKYIIGLDEGTTGCKTCIFDFDGNLVGSDYREYPCIYFPDHPGWVEQSADDITPALYASIKAAITSSGIDANEIEALGLSSQGAVLGMVDKNGETVHNFISWNDSRCFGEMNDELVKRMDPREYYEITGFNPYGATPIKRHLWLQKYEPELYYEKTAMFVTNQEYFLRKLGADGWFADSSSISREGIVDLATHDYSEKIFDAFGMDLSKRNPRVPHGTPVGEVTPKISELTGLPVGCKICVGAMDQDCSPFGCGNIRNGDTAIVMGTYGATFICSDKPLLDPNPSMLWVKSHTYFGEGGINTYTIEGGSTTSASSYRWYRDKIGKMEVAAAGTTGLDAYDLINSQVEKSRPGANGITFLPFLQGRQGGKTNGEARAAFIGMSLATERSDLARAVMEGICYEINEILNAEKAAGFEPKDIKLTGGAAKSPLWLQMQADIYQRPITVLQTTENGCLGAALFAGVGTGIYKDAYEAVDRAVHVGKTYEPNPENFAAYEEAYQRFEDYFDKLFPVE